MKPKLLSILIIFPMLSFAQDSVKIAKKMGYDSTLENQLILRRHTSVEFYNFTKRLANASDISILYTDFNKNLDPNLDKKNYILNADVQVPIVLGGKRWYFRTSKGLWFNTVQVIPQFQIRIFRNDKTFKDASQPVRTPSYLPRITYFGSPGSWQKENKKKLIFFSAFHHSNGQDGSEFFTADSSYAFWKKGRINTYNGNFGENLVFELGFGSSRNHNEFSIEDTKFYRLKRQIQLLEKDQGRPVFSSSETAFIRTQNKFSLEYHPKSLTNSAFDALELYGRMRLNTQLGLSFIAFPVEFIKKLNEVSRRPFYSVFGKAKMMEQFRFVLDNSIILDRNFNKINENSKLLKAGLSNRINIKLTYYNRIGGTSSTALFFQGGYYGSDPYNIYFGQRALYFRFGISFLYFEYQ